MTAVQPNVFRLLAVAASSLVIQGSAVVAADAPPGALGCVGCHGAGDSAAMPPLKGRSAADIAAALKDYREGKRDPSVMDRIAKGFSHAEAEAIAQWIAAQN